MPLVSSVASIKDGCSHHDVTDWLMKSRFEAVLLISHFSFLPISRKRLMGYCCQHRRPRYSRCSNFCHLNLKVDLPEKLRVLDVQASEHTMDDAAVSL